MNIPEIGDELAAARTLSDLAHQLLEAAANDVEGITREPVHLSERTEARWRTQTPPPGPDLVVRGPVRR